MEAMDGGRSRPDLDGLPLPCFATVRRPGSDRTRARRRGRVRLSTALSGAQVQVRRPRPSGLQGGAGLPARNRVGRLIPPGTGLTLEGGGHRLNLGVCFLEAQTLSGVENHVSAGRYVMIIDMTRYRVYIR